MSLFPSTTPSIQSRISYLRSLPAIRERCVKVHDLAKEGKLEYFDYHPEKEAEVVDYCTKIIQRDFGTNYDSIPPHSRWRHFDVGHPRIDPLIKSWRTSSLPDLEIAKRLIDLFLVSVLLDAGAGNAWKYAERSTAANEVYTRSEGLAVASLDMFVDGFFSADDKDKLRVDASALEKITTEGVAKAMQVSDSNPMSGIDGRTGLLCNLAQALRSSKEFFGEGARPGNMLDYLATTAIQSPEGQTTIHISALFGVLIEGLAPIWPTSRSSLAGVSLGDVWPCTALSSASTTKSALPDNIKLNPASSSAVSEGDDLVPFHKLTQWITYSLVEPIGVVLGWKVEGMEDMTGLPEYRNGGLLVDFGVLSLRSPTVSSYYESPNAPPRLPPSHPAIIEWRAMTVIELDRIAEGIRKKVGYNLKLAQVLESATWKGGREIAKTNRPSSGGPPIEIESDGTVF